jgi:hypothetical protein
LDPSKPSPRIPRRDEEEDVSSCLLTVLLVLFCSGFVMMALWDVAITALMTAVKGG